MPMSEILFHYHKVDPTTWVYLSSLLTILGTQSLMAMGQVPDPATGQPRYFFAPGSAALQGILKDIGTTIRKVRIAE